MHVQLLEVRAVIFSNGQTNSLEVEDFPQVNLPAHLFDIQEIDFEFACFSIKLSRIWSSDVEKFNHKVRFSRKSVKLVLNLLKKNLILARGSYNIPLFNLFNTCNTEPTFVCVFGLFTTATGKEPYGRASEPILIFYPLFTI